MEQSLFGALAAHGLPGLIIFALGFWVVILHRELRDERLARINDVKTSYGLMIEIHTKVLGAVEKLADVQQAVAANATAMTSTDAHKRRS